MTTKEKVLDAFRSDLGQQLDLLYVTEDDRIFIRPYEALNHVEENNLSDDIQEWCRYDLEELSDAYQFIEDNLEKYEGKIKALKDVCIRKNQLSYMLEDYHKQQMEWQERIKEFSNASTIEESINVDTSNDDLPF
jgi:hypothetical protein